jgi:hypothetical protein
LEEQFIQLFANDIELTSLVTPSDAFGNSSVAKTVSFKEPSSAAVLALKGYRINEFSNPLLRLKCSCTRADSPWNFTSEESANWTNVAALTGGSNAFPSDWYSKFYTGPEQTPTQFDAFQSVNSNCGVLSTSQTLKAVGRSAYYSFRKYVTQSFDCGTNAPTLPTSQPTPPTGKPTRSPTTSRPTRSPTNIPTTGAPSQAPMASAPSRAPSISSPTFSPTVTPSRSPACYGEVTCCVSFDPTLISKSK